MLGLLLPFLLKFLGEGAIQSWMKAKVDIASSAAEVDKAYLNAQVKAMEYELARRQAQRDLEIAELPYRSMRYPKAFIEWTVALYWGARFMAEGFNVTAFKVTITELSPAATAVSSMVLGYMFLSGDIQKIMRK